MPCWHHVSSQWMWYHLVIVQENTLPVISHMGPSDKAIAKAVMHLNTLSTVGAAVCRPLFKLSAVMRVLPFQCTHCLVHGICLCLALQ